MLYLSTWRSRSTPPCSARSPPRPTPSRRRSTPTAPGSTASELTDSEVRKVLKESEGPGRAPQAVWEASKGVGPVVEADLKALVQLRNEAARALGFANFHAMQLALNEQTRTRSSKLFDDLDALTREPFRAAKAEIDAKLAERLRRRRSTSCAPGTTTTRSSRRRPPSSTTDLDAAYAKADILKLCRDFYAGIGLPIDDVIARSDLYEKPGKSPHAFCTDIDREGDVRVLANIVPNEYWMGTMLHELGHSVYSSKNIPASLPYVLRTEAHILDHRGRGHDVRAVLARTPTGSTRDGRPARRPEGVRRGRRRRCGATSC